MIGFNDKANSSKGKGIKSADTSKNWQQSRFYWKWAYFLDEIGIIESVKSVSNIIAPLTGVVTEVNDALSDQPDLVNQSAQDEGKFLFRRVAWTLLSTYSYSRTLFEFEK